MQMWYHVNDNYFEYIFFSFLLYVCHFMIDLVIKLKKKIKLRMSGERGAPPPPPYYVFIAYFFVFFFIIYHLIILFVIRVCVINGP